jgi:hypothetical protein
MSAPVTVLTPAEVGGALGEDEALVLHLSGSLQGMVLVNKLSDTTVVPAAASRDVLYQQKAVFAAGGEPPADPPPPERLVPILVETDPFNVRATQGLIQVTIIGSNLYPESVVYAQDEVVPSTFGSVNHLFAMIDFTDVPPMINFRVTVSNGPGKTATLLINVLQPL